MNKLDTVELFSKYVAANYTRYDIVFVKGVGSLLWDSEGKRYIDFFPGWAVDGLGHCPPRVVEAIRKQAGELIHVANNFYTEPQGLLAREIAKASFGGKSFFCNSGAEAIEAAIKCARLWGSENGNRHKIITMEHSFHGRTYGAICATGQPAYRKGIGPELPGFEHVPFGDLEATKKAADESTVAIIVEPVQGEGGVRVAERDFMRGLRALCDERNMLLITDEVQTGMGRTGKWFGYQHYDITPDMMTLAKSLGGGVAVGALVGKGEIMAALKPGTHASTFGGNPIAMSAALATFQTIHEDNLIERANTLGGKLGEWLEKVEALSCVKETRRLGLMSAIELTMPGAELVNKCLDLGLHVNCTQGNVLRVVPAANIEEAILDEGLELLFGVLNEVPLDKASAPESN